MCLILATNNVNTILDQVTNHELMAASRANSDGVGVMYFKDGEFVVDKLNPTNTNAGEQVDFIMHHATLPGVTSFAAHLRMCTDGSVCELNTHPYMITSKEQGDMKDIYMMHNGVIAHCRGAPKWNPEDKDSETMSDTAVFAVNYLRPILKAKPNLIFNEGLKNMMAHVIGAGSKLCFMDDKGQLVFINKQAGGLRTDKDGNELWLSSPWYLNATYNRGGASTNGGATFRQPAPAYAPQKAISQGAQSTQTQTATGTKTKPSIVGGGLTVNKNLIEMEGNDMQDKIQGSQLALDFLSKDKTKELTASSAGFGEEPNLKDRTFRQDMVNLRDTLIDLDYQDIVDFCFECPEDAASLIYLHLHAYKYAAVDDKFFQEDEAKSKESK